jgi:hypothetical protein
MDFSFDYIAGCIAHKRCRNYKKKEEKNDCKTCIPLCKSLEEQKKHIEYTVSLIDKYITQIDSYKNLGTTCSTPPVSVECQIVQNLQLIVQNLTVQLNNLYTLYQATLAKTCSNSD